MKITQLLRNFLLMALVSAFVAAFSQDADKNNGYKQFTYPDGKISSEGFLKNGKPDGYWKAYNQNGTLKSEGNRRNFELDSLWKFYDEEGKLLLEINYQAGKKSGIKTTYTEKEIIRENFKNDVKEGYTRIYYPDEKIKSEIPFVRGLEQGFGKEYDKEGTIITLTEYKKGFVVDRLRINRKDGSGLKQGRWYIFYPSGNVQIETSYKDDKIHGYYKEYAENGDLLKILKYENGELLKEAQEIKKLEVQNEYYPDGKVKISGTFRDGVPEGIIREYDTTGMVEQATTYEDGKVTGVGIVKDNGNKQGAWKEYHSDGSLRAEGSYDNGKRVGEWKFYYPNGKTEQRGKYNKSGKPDGTWRWYYENGELHREESYLAGLKDGLSTTYDENGNVIEEGEYVEDLEDGPWKEKIGDTYTRGFYSNGMRNGMWYYFYLDEKEKGTDSILVFKGAYIDDNARGKHIYYYPNGRVKSEGNYITGRREGNWSFFNEDGTLFLIITYKNGVETRYDGVKIKPAYEREEE